MTTEERVLEFMREEAYKPMTYKELEKRLGDGGADSFKAFLRLLNELEEEGKIVRTHSDRYGVPERMNLVRGRVQAHPKGFAFVLPEEKGHPDVYIHGNDLKSAMNRDTVLVKVTSRSEGGGRLEGEVVRVVERAVTQVVGTFENHESYGFIIPDDKRLNRDIFIPEGQFKGAVSGQKVVARIVSYPEGHSAAEGEIVEILGHKDDPGVDILSIIRKHQLPEGFPEDVMDEAEAAPDSITEEEIVRQGRRDLRDKVIVTIDGEDAKDLDDAVNVERLPNGNFLLGVHIADVSYYVREHSALDQEAYRRGCSVYLVDRVIPMLPHRLSNGICSLNPQVDRLTMSCEMEFDAKTLKRVRHDVFTSVIRTKERMTYTNVRKIVADEDPETMERYADLVDTFKLMEELALRLRAMRMKRGAIDFDFVESKVVVDESGKPVDIVKRERSIAEQIIEEFMLAANETVAEHFYWLRVPFLYRIHENPDSEKLMNFVRFAANFGYTVKGKGGSEIHPRALQTLLEDIRGTKEQTVISTVMLRSMKQAKYDAESLGHFGLAAEFYSHFTSPIRRYPDLVIHRVIREVLESGGTLSEARLEALVARMPDIAQQSSERERVAADAERDTQKMKKAEYMLDKIGEEFDGIISGVTGFGIFVELDNTVEGLIRLSELHDDYYHFHEDQMLLIGERTSNIFRIGDELRVRVEEVNMEEYTVGFAIAESEGAGRRSRRFEGPGFGRRGRDAGVAGDRSGGRSTGAAVGGEAGSGRRGGRLAGTGTAAVGGKRGGRKGQAGGRAEDAGARSARGKNGGGVSGRGAVVARRQGGGLNPVRVEVGPRGRGTSSRSDRPQAARDDRAWKPEDDYNLDRLLGINDEAVGRDAVRNADSGEAEDRGVAGTGAADGSDAAGRSRSSRQEGAAAKGKIRTDMWGLPIHGTGGIIDDGDNYVDTYQGDMRGPGGRRSAGPRGASGRGAGGGRGKSVARGAASARNGGGTVSGASAGSRRKKTSESGIVNAAGANGGSGGTGKARKKKNGGSATAAFVRKKRK